MLRGFDFTPLEYAGDRSGTIEAALAYMHMTVSDKPLAREVGGYLDAVCNRKMMDSAEWETMPAPLEDGGRITCRIGGRSVSARVDVSPKRLAVTMDLPRRGTTSVKILETLAPVIFTRYPYEGSEAGEYGEDVARRLLVVQYYSYLAHKN